LIREKQWTIDLRYKTQGSRIHRRFCRQCHAWQWASPARVVPQADWPPSWQVSPGLQGRPHWQQRNRLPSGLCCQSNSTGRMPVLILLAAREGARPLSGNPAWVVRQQPPLSRGQQRATIRGLRRMMIQWVSLQAPVPNEVVAAMACGSCGIEALYPPLETKDKTTEGQSHLQAMHLET